MGNHSPAKEAPHARPHPAERHSRLPAPSARPACGGQVSHALARVARSHRTTAGHLLRRLGLYPGQELLMMRLWEAGPQRQSELIKLMELDPSTVTRMVQRLEQAGLISRCAHPGDRRAVLIETTPAGEALREEVEQVWRDLEERTVAGLTEADRAELSRLLSLLERNLATG
ncbi:MarR family winged helix-turn-helix transcriptional regulator [Streptomyces triculaminicus]|uniref:MarR family winged helix-turn-helix transcriptional regulator n=1 Tax=Streptomyces triculaminicus TaxID=2816232 RepID=UPI0027DCFE3F|nr:MarR family transcriptional regulator [Streptomyces triculaminicus]